ncbi:ribonuclease T [Roseobacter sp. HKCCD9010]|uniref:ribonuclease T2 n=1 Tax=unclassified Roseobacter TaxID=196798 RepID=UPI0019F3BC0C|nr:MULTISPECIES: ribonuclease T2 [unclassified Roseobacter]MBF9048731.1 ribonuclease T [Rhodobacterales bacterium HKCCD4356]NNV10730.1 ribonuclease T [Roseobacter sp. HKCCD7357]NNV14915.1 ribonuclease T [Roseobacter sp. HKCCD8768]NNV24374.1 ribonuclease T [Roseobacter sp. HKCCD8192]NNV28631.1 ribonuclease T [Roseobacter sp. HKCCD9061]
MMRILLALLLVAGIARAEGEAAGEFDYYVLSLSWTPSWCAIEGDARESEQCDPGQGYGFTLHGLWPQYERGWPSYCPTSERAPSRAMTADMIDIMGSSGLAWHQWRKHGVCSGLSATDYYALSREAYERVTRPDLLRQLDREVRLPAAVIEEAFLEANPALAPDMLTVTCRDRRIQEVRLCFTRDLEPRLCGDDVVRDCTLADAVFSPMR